MTGKYECFFSIAIVALLHTAEAQQPSPQQAPPPMRAAPDVKIETTELAPGIYVLTGRGGNIGLEEKYGGASFNAAQWIGRAYVDQKIAAGRRNRK